MSGYNKYNRCLGKLHCFEIFLAKIVITYSIRTFFQKSVLLIQLLRCVWLFATPMDCHTPAFPVLHDLLESVTVSIFFPLSIGQEVMWLDAVILVFWMLSSKPAFLLFSFIFIKRLFSFSYLFAIRVMQSTYVKLLILLLAILIPACDSSSLAFHMMCCAYKLNKQGDNI